MNTKQDIKKHLAKSVKFRDDDRLLRLEVWKDFGFHLTPEQMKIYPELPADGVISRRRRELRGEFPDSEHVQEKRFNKFKEEREKRSSWFARKLSQIIDSKS